MTNPHAACPTAELRRPCHSHPVNPTYELSDVQRRALGYARQGAVRVLISACGPDASTRATVEHVGTPYWVRARSLPQWLTYKSLYKAGVVLIVRDDTRYPYDYKIVPNPEHPINQGAS